MNRRLLFFCAEDWFVCSHWLPQIAAAQRAGYEVHVATRVRGHGAMIEATGAKLVPLDLSRRGMNPLAELKLLFDLVRLYRRLRPDLAHHVAMKPMVYGTLAARIANTPAIVNYMAGLGWLFTADSAQARLLRPGVRWTLGRLLAAGRVIVENPDDAAQVLALGVESRRLHRIRGAGVDLAVFSPRPEAEGVPLVVLPARMLWTKGVGEFVEAARQLKAAGVAARFALVGDPDPENPASVPQEQLAAWAEEGAVECWGRRGDMPEVLAEAHIVCLPSYREGLPKALIEAAAAGRAIVTTDTPGCREVVAAGDNGLLVPARDGAALAEALRALIADPGSRRRMGRRGREIAEAEFAVERIVAETLAVYRAFSA